MNGRAARFIPWFAWVLGGLCVAMFVAAVIFTLLTLLERGEPISGLGVLVIFVPFLAFPVVGALVGSKRPGNPIGWICLAAGLLWMFIAVQETYDAFALARYGRFWSPVALDALTQWIWVPPVGLLGIFTILLFPDGKLPSRRWRPLAWFSGAVMAVISVGFIFVPGPLERREGVRNPFGLESLAWVTDIAVFVILLLPVCILASAISLVFRFRRARGEERQQIKWLALAACFVGATYLGGLLAQLLFAPESLEAGGPSEPLWVTLINIVTAFSYAGIPIAVGFAVLKYRLYDIEIIVNRTLVYAPLTASLAAVYAGSVVSLQFAFRELTGQTSQLVVVASTLVIAALFSPLRRRIQDLVDRRFYRKKYDARRTLDEFGARLRDETDLEALNGDLVAVARETVQPSHVSLWLRSPGHGGTGE